MSKLTQDQKKDLLLLADHMESEVLEDELDMGDWVENCGTVGCLAFHAAQLFPDRFRLEKTRYAGCVNYYKIINPQTGSAYGNAFKEVFGPGTEELCYRSGYDWEDTEEKLTPKLVAKGIRLFVEGAK